MFKKVNRLKTTNIRKKNFDDINEPEVKVSEAIPTNESTEIKTTVNIIETTIQDSSQNGTEEPREKIKQKKTLKTQTISLSFDDGEDLSAPVFEIKKSSASRRLAKNKVKELKIDNYNIEEPERISEVKYDEDTLSLLKQQQNILNNRPSMNDDGSYYVNDTLIVIPDSNAIFTAKKKRERLRQGIIDPEDDDLIASKKFIPLKNGNDNKDSLESRLIREEDDLGDGEDELNTYLGERFKLKKGDMKEQLHQQAIDEMRETLNEFDNEGSDPEYEALERERLRQALGNQKLSASMEIKSQANQFSLPKAMPLPTFSQIQTALKVEMLQHKERIKPYESALETKNMNIMILDERLKEMSLNRETLESRIMKYEAMLVKYPKGELRSSSTKPEI